MFTKGLGASCLAWMCAFHALPGLPAAAMAQSPGDTIMDIDGNVYHTVTIGTQVWMVENLKTSRLDDGTPIQLAPISNIWRTTVAPAYCWLNDDSTYKESYGALYNWYAVNSGKLAPPGWHVPTEEDWKILSNFLGGDSVAGGKLKDTGLVHWKSPNAAATNETGFTALPGGDRNSNGSYRPPREIGAWWTATPYNGNDSAAYYISMFSNNGTFWQSAKLLNAGVSVRCIRNPPPPAIPSLLSPADDAANVPLTTALSWSAADAAVTYRLQAAEDAAFASPILDSSGISGLSVSVGPLASGTTYHWRVAAVNWTATSGWSEVRNFTTVSITPPAAPVPFAPANGNAITAGAVSFSCRPVSGADTYRFQIGESAAFSNPLYDTTVLQDTVFRGDLATERKYYWRVNAANAGGTSPWSDVCSLTTKMALPATITLKTPSFGSTVSTDQFTLVWSRSTPHITEYRLQLAQDSRFTDMQIDSTLGDTAAVIRYLQDGYTYWWRVQARNAEGWGEWSESGSFLVVLPVALRQPPQAAAPGVSVRDGVFRYRLASGGPVAIRVYDMRGKVVFSRAHLYQPAGWHELPIAPASGNSRLLLEFTAGNPGEKMLLPTFSGSGIGPTP